MVTRPKYINNTDRKFPPDQEVLLIRRLVRYVYLHVNIHLQLQNKGNHSQAPYTEIRLLSMRFAVWFMCLISYRNLPSSSSSSSSTTTESSKSSSSSSSSLKHNRR